MLLKPQELAAADQFKAIADGELRVYVDAIRRDLLTGVGQSEATVAVKIHLKVLPKIVLETLLATALIHLACGQGLR